MDYFKKGVKNPEEVQKIVNRMNQIEYEMKSPFRPFEGVNLPPILGNTQKRFSQAKNKAQNFSFYPNYHITSKIF